MVNAIWLEAIALGLEAIAGSRSTRKNSLGGSWVIPTVVSRLKAVMDGSLRHFINQLLHKGGAQSMQQLTQLIGCLG